MSGIKDSNLQRAYQLMHERGETTMTLADKLDTSRAYVSRMISGGERRGRQWQRLCRLLTPEERALLEAVPEREPQGTGFREPMSYAKARSF